MEITTIQKFIHTSPRKLRLVADMIRKLNPVQALGMLQLTPKAAAKDLQKAVETVLANAKQQGLDMQKVNFSKIEVNESTKMRRFRAGTKGRVRPFKRRMSHIKIVLTDDLNLKTQMSNGSQKRILQAKTKTEKQKENISKQKKSVMDDSAVKNKLTEGDRTESSKT